MKASVILPAYNEENNIAAVLDAVPAKYEIIVVDDGSTDRTLEIAKSYGCNCIRFAKNTGKGAACVAGARLAANENLVFIDSDGQLDAKEIPLLLRALRNCDLAVGTRSIEDIPVQRRISNNFAKAVLSKAAGKRLGDVLCGFRAIRKGNFLSLHLKKKRYEIETEMIIKAVRRGLKIKEVPISVRYGIGSSMPFADSMKVASYLIGEAMQSSYKNTIKQ